MILRTTSIGLILLTSLLLTNCDTPESKPEAVVPAAPKIDMAAEEAAIKAAIIGETAAFIATDTDKLLSYHTDPTTKITTEFNTDNIYSYTISHTDAKPLFQAYFDDEKNEMTSDVKRSGWNIHVSKDASMAWASYKAEATVGGSQISTEEMRALEKVDGTWKLALTGTVMYPAQ